MKKTILTWALLQLVLPGNAQNLVPNGDFEQYTACPVMQGQLINAAPWINPSVSTSAADYFNQCAGSGSNGQGVPQNLCGYQNAHSGNGYAGIYIVQNPGANTREYLEAPLTSTLTAGACYHFEMYASLANNFKLTSDDIGVYFSDTLITGTSSNLYPLPFTPQITNLTGVYPDTLSWTLISGDYYASGTENYLIVGNFLYDTATTLINTNSAGNFNWSFFLIDDVSLVWVPCSGINELNSASAFAMYPNPANDVLTIRLNTSYPAFAVNAKTQLVIKNMLGQEILCHTFSSSEHTINTSTYASGIYMAEITGGKHVFRKIFLKK